MNYKAKINGWSFSAVGCKGFISVSPDICEQMTVELYTTGLRGGDTSHGGTTELVIRESGGGAHMLPVVEANKWGDLDSVTVIAQGDWELDGLVCALMFLGRILETEGVCKMTEFSMTESKHAGEQSCLDDEGGAA